jgi:hypothetical protein
MERRGRGRGEGGKGRGGDRRERRRGARGEKERRERRNKPIIKKNTKGFIDEMQMSSPSLSSNRNATH